MRKISSFCLAGIIILALVGCSTEQQAESALASLLISSDEADSWVITSDDGSVDGDTGDCTGAPYDWPDSTTIDHASQFLDRQDESLAVIVKRLDGPAAPNVDALRGALAPCAPELGETRHGAMISIVGDDSFAYQSSGTDDLGSFITSTMLISCGDLVLEVYSRSYSGQLDQAELEDLIAPTMYRIVDAGGCGS